MRVFAYPAFANKHLNPYNALLYDSVKPLVDEVVEFRPRRWLRGPIDILHLHWPDLVVRGSNALTSLARASAILMRLAECRARGARVVWTVHNIAPHDIHHAWLEAGFRSAFVRLLDGLTFLSAASRDEVLATHPELKAIPYAIIPHGHYKPIIDAPQARSAARQQLNLPADKFTFLHFGLVREYKNIPLLVREFLALERPDVFLIIAGSAGSRGPLRTEIEQIVADRDNIRLDLRYIPEQTLHAYLAACDCVVLPYKKVLNSGSVMLALSAARPVVAPAVGSLVEIAGPVGPRWLRCYSGGFGRSQLLAALGEPLPEGSAPELSPFDWDVIAMQTVDFYRRLAACHRR